MPLTAIRSHRVGLPLTLILAAFLGFTSPARAQAPADPGEASLQAMHAAAGGSVSTVSSRLTGLVSFMSTKPGAPVPVAAAATDSAEARAAAFLSAYGRAFGIAGPAWGRVERVSGPDDLGMERVRYRQLHAGVPVTAGEMSIHLNGASVVAVAAKTLVVKNKINPRPSFSAEEATARAKAFVDKHFPGMATSYTEPRLEVFNRGLLEGKETPTRLAWFIEAKGDRFWRYIWIDAHTGMRLLHFSQLPHAKSRKIFDGNNVDALPGTLLRSEGEPPVPPGNPASTDANFAYDFAGDTYDYYLIEHGRDSIDGHGLEIISTVRHCEGACPFNNAFWNGNQMVYGPGFASADDVVGHELTHGVTQFSANLFYFMQSGALNESFSDIFGESVDLLYGPGNDSPGVRWLIGEDLSIGAIRNMMNPNQFGHPASVTDPLFFCTTQPLTDFGDNGGVHSNSGVPNHAYALMVDGGVYNGFAISGIGLHKAGKIQYRALTTYLLSGSNFFDNYNALKQSCADLTPAVVTAAECLEVAKALDAVQLANPLPCPDAQPVSVPLCPAGQVASNVLFDNLENSGSGNWVISSLTPGDAHWYYPGSANPLGIDAFATSGVNNFWADNRPSVGDSVIAMTNGVVIPGGARLQFNHAYSFENGTAMSAPGVQVNFDGGVIEYSTDGGGTWKDAGALFSGGATYGGTLDDRFANPLAGRNAFVKESFGYTASQLDLSSLAGQSVRFRFRIGTDEDIEDFGWFIDDVRIYSCVAGVPLASAILPVSRAVQVNNTATVFATIINAGTDPANNVSIGLTTPMPGTLTYQTTDAGNNLTGSANTPVTIPPGGIQNFLIAFTPNQTFGPTNVHFNMSGTNTLPAASTSGLNTFLLSSTAGFGPDIIALAATFPNPALIVDLPGNDGVGAFAVAAANVGGAGEITVTVNKGNLPVSVVLCQTGPGGACLGTPSTNVTVTIAAGGTPTFSFFVQGGGFVPFDPANNRIFATFTHTATGNIVGATSTAVRTQ